MQEGGRAVPWRSPRRGESFGPTVIVVDAGVLAPALADDGPDGDRCRIELAASGGLAAPDLVDLEVLSVWRGLHRAGKLSRRRVEMAMADLSDLPLQRCGHLRLRARCWELRNNLTTYDAVYVALAEALNVPLLTSDARLAAAPGIRCEVAVVA